MFKFKANAKDVRIIWLESLATFKTSFPEWREEKREDKEGREGSSVVRNCQGRKSGPLSLAGIIVLIVT